MKLLFKFFNKGYEMFFEDLDKKYLVGLFKQYAAVAVLGGVLVGGTVFGLTGCDQKAEEQTAAEVIKDAGGVDKSDVDDACQSAADELLKTMSRAEVEKHMKVVCPNWK